MRRIRFLLGAISNWCAFALTLAVAFFLAPTLRSALGVARYDVFCVVESILAYFTLLDMGLAAFLVREVAKHRATGNSIAINRAASMVLALFLAAAVLALLIGGPFLWGMSDRLGEKSEGDPGVLPFMLLMLLNLAMTLPLSVFPGILDGLERYTTKSLVRIGALALRTIGLVIAANRGEGLFPLAVVYTASNLIEHLALAICAKYSLPRLKFRIRYLQKRTLREVRTYSVDAFLAMLAGRIAVQTGAIVIGLFLPTGQVTFFAIALRLVDYAKTLLRTITATLTPNVSAMQARGDTPAIAKLFLKATRWVLYLALPVNIGLFLFGGPFLVRWMGPEFLSASYPALALMAAGLALSVAQSAASRILYGLGHLKWFARAALAEAGLNVLLTALLIGPFGVPGVAFAVTLPHLLFCGFVIALAARHLGVSPRCYLLEWSRPLLLNAIPLFIWIRLGTPEPDYFAIGGAVAAGLLPYGFAVAGVELAAQWTGKRRSRRNSLKLHGP